MSKDSPLPSGKIPPTLLSAILADAPQKDERIVVGPAIGMDCAIIDFGDRYLVVKNDPITFATKDIGWYLVQVNANDIATSGAAPRWLMLTLLLPNKTTYSKDAIAISRQVYEACKQLGISVVGGHSEITYGIDRPILSGTLFGEVSPEDLVTPDMASPGDKLLLTKGVPIEAVSILAHEFQDEIVQRLGQQAASEAHGYLYDPGISVYLDAQTACKAGRVTAMHDPTEGGLANGLWELAQASGLSISIDLNRVHVPALAANICEIFHLNPFAAISSGALLIAVHPDDASKVCQELLNVGIDCACIGQFSEGPPSIQTNNAEHDEQIALPVRDEVARLFDERLS